MTLAIESAGTLAGEIRDGQISSRELADYYIARIERFDGPLNAVPVRDFDHARVAADAADAAMVAGRFLGPLHGLPMTIEESFNIAGLPTTWGHPALKDNVGRTDAAGNVLRPVHD
ncbi:MAG: amidase family protein [Alphaproteobacteria bacterium]|jgi:amidase